MASLESSSTTIQTDQILFETVEDLIGQYSTYLEEIQEIYQKMPENGSSESPTEQITEKLFENEGKESDIGDQVETQESQNEVGGFDGREEEVVGKRGYCVKIHEVSEENGSVQDQSDSENDSASLVSETPSFFKGRAENVFDEYYELNSVINKLVNKSSLQLTEEEKLRGDKFDTEMAEMNIKLQIQLSEMTNLDQDLDDIHDDFLVG